VGRSDAAVARVLSPAPILRDDRFAIPQDEGFLTFTKRSQAQNADRPHAEGSPKAIVSKHEAVLTILFAALAFRISAR
jgi:hypothetical protein